MLLLHWNMNYTCKWFQPRFIVVLTSISSGIYLELLCFCILYLLLHMQGLTSLWCCVDVYPAFARRCICTIRHFPTTNAARSTYNKQSFFFNIHSFIDKLYKIEVGCLLKQIWTKYFIGLKTRVNKTLFYLYLIYPHLYFNYELGKHVFSL